MFGERCIRRLHNQNGYKLKGASKREKHGTQDRQFGCAAQIIQSNNASIISSTIDMLMWF